MDKKPELSSFAEHYIFKHKQLSNSLINDTSPFTLLILYKCNSYLDRKYVKLGPTIVGPT